MVGLLLRILPAEPLKLPKDPQPAMPIEISDKEKPKKDKGGVTLAAKVERAATP